MSASSPQSTFAAKVDYATGVHPYSVAAVDVNGDNHPDLVVANYSSNTVSVLLNNGNGTFAAKVDYATGSGPWSVAAADFNGDGHPDLAVANYSINTVSVLLNNGNGTFAAKVDYATGFNPKSVAAVDVNGDGHPDLAVGNSRASLWPPPGMNSTVSVLLNNGNGTFTAKVDYGAGDNPQSVTSADFNGDTHPDIVVANSYSNTLSVLLNNGNGTFAAKVDYATGNHLNSVAAADFNGDAYPDLVAANGSSNTVSVLLNNGNGTFAAKVDYATGSGPWSVAAADFNGDGHPDLVVANSSSNTVSVLLNNGNGTFAAKVDYAAGTYPFSVAAVDVNGDTNPDIVVTNYSSNTVSVLNFVQNLTMALSGSGNVTPAVGTHTYPVDTVVSINAIAATNWAFVNWTGNVSTIANTSLANTTITMNGDYAITANFNRVAGTLTTAVSGSGNVTPSMGTQTYPVGTSVNIVATPASGWRFRNWTGDTTTVASASSANTTIIMSDDFAITANFTQTSLTMAKSGSGDVTPSAGSHTYAVGEAVNILATPASNWAFVNWTGETSTVADASSANSTIIMNNDYSITANFNRVAGTLTMGVSGSGSVTPPAGTQTYPAGSSVNILAVPISGWQFNGWTGDISTVASASSDNTTITINGDYLVTANFTQIPTGGGGGGGGGGGSGTTVVGDLIAGNQFLYPAVAKSTDQKVNISIPKGTVATTESGKLNSISILVQRELPESVQSWGVDLTAIGVIYNLQPEGTTFDPPVDLSLKYDSEDKKQIPAGVDEKNLVIATYDMTLGKWVTMDSAVDTEKSIVTTKLGHFSLYTIMAPRVAPASFTVSDLHVTPAEVTAGETVTVSAVVANTGSQSGNYKLDLKIDGAVAQTKEVTVGAGATETVSFTITTKEAGNHTVDAGGLPGAYQVKAPKTPAAFTVANLSVSPASVKVGEKVTISVTVSNTGETDGTYGVTLKIDGKVVDTREVLLAGNTSADISFTVNGGEPGTYAVEANGTTGSFVVEKEPSATPEATANSGEPPVAETALPTKTSSTNWWLIGGSIFGVSLIGLTSSMFILRRRRTPNIESTGNKMY